MNPSRENAPHLLHAGAARSCVKDSSPRSSYMIWFVPHATEEDCDCFFGICYE